MIRCVLPNISHLTSPKVQHSSIYIINMQITCHVFLFYVYIYADFCYIRNFRRTKLKDSATEHITYSGVTEIFSNLFKCMKIFSTLIQREFPNKLTSARSIQPWFIYLSYILTDNCQLWVYSRWLNFILNS